MIRCIALYPQDMIAVIIIATGYFQVMLSKSKFRLG
jgi:hypothetical protein